MMRNGKSLALALSALTYSTGALALSADSSGNPYHGIVERNVFDIHAAVAPPPDPRAGLPPPPTIKLQGITDILGRKQVLFKVQLPPKPGTVVKEESFILTIGERQGEIEVLDIDPKAGTVKVNNYGMVTNLSLELNSDKLVNVAPVSAPPPQPMPGQVPGAAPTTMPPTPATPTLPVTRIPRTLRLPGSPNTPMPPGPAGGFSGSSYNAGGSAQPQLSSDEVAVGLAARKLKAQQEGNPMSRIMPVPPGLTQEFQNNQNSGEPTSQQQSPSGL